MAEEACSCGDAQHPALCRGPRTAGRRLTSPGTAAPATRPRAFRRSLGWRREAWCAPALLQGLTQRYLEVSQEQAPTLRQVAAFLLANSDLGWALLF